jgi:misacylated tRNA(Ala) deacylase
MTRENPSPRTVYRSLTRDCARCCGTHLCQTSHISLLLLHHTQQIQSKNTRLYFTAGERAIDLSSSSIRCQRSIAGILTSGAAPTEVLERVETTNQRLIELKRKEKKLMNEIAMFEADRVKRLLVTERKGWVYRADGGLEYLDTVVHEIRDAIKESVVLLAAGEGKKGGPLVIVGEENLVSLWAGKAKELVKQLKGGVKGWKWQGKVVEWGKGELEALKSAVHE